MNKDYRRKLCMAVKESIKKFDVLNQRELKILKMRFGLDDGVVLTLEKISKEFCISRERVRQIEGKALSRLGLYKAKL